MPPLYARYVPPTASGSNGPGAAAPSESHGATQITVTPNTDSKDGRKKRKRSELEESERKTRKDQSKREKAQVNGAAEDIHMSSGDGAAKTDRVEHGGLPKREKKDKKSNKDYGQATEDGDVQAPEDTIVSETAPTKHDSVLSKYQKATLRSARALSIEPDSEQEPAEKPVLHGMEETHANRSSTSKLTHTRPDASSSASSRSNSGIRAYLFCSSALACAPRSCLAYSYDPI